MLAAGAALFTAMCGAYMLRQNTATEEETKAAPDAKKKLAVVEESKDEDIVSTKSQTTTRPQAATHQDGEEKTLLVTGGTGYIGSHTVVELLETPGHCGFTKIVIVDDLSNSSDVCLQRM